MDKPNTPENLLSSSSAMDEFIHALAGRNMCNASGSAYRAVRLCYYENGILLRSYHNTSDHCDISVASDREARIIPGSQDSWGNRSPSPTVDRGELIQVWGHGKWTKRGPWEQPIRELLASLIERLAKAKDLARREAEEKAAQKERERQQRDMDLAAAWGEGQANG